MSPTVTGTLTREPEKSVVVSFTPPRRGRPHVLDRDVHALALLLERDRHGALHGRLGEERARDGGHDLAGLLPGRGARGVCGGHGPEELELERGVRVEGERELDERRTRRGPLCQRVRDELGGGLFLADGELRLGGRDVGALGPGGVRVGEQGAPDLDCLGHHAEAEGAASREEPELGPLGVLPGRGHREAQGLHAAAEARERLDLHGELPQVRGILREGLVGRGQRLLELPRVQELRGAGGGRLGRRRGGSGLGPRCEAHDEREDDGR